MTFHTFLRTALTAAVLAALAAAWAPPPNFAGTWVLNGGKSKNLGPMAAMRDTVIIEQTPAALTTRDQAAFQGKAMPARATRYDLSGKSVANTSPTGDPAHTTSQWAGAELVTVWVTAGSVEGSVHRRTERRSLSADGRTMTLVSEAAPGDPKAITMVFERTVRP